MPPSSFTSVYMGYSFRFLPRRSKFLKTFFSPPGPPISNYLLLQPMLLQDSLLQGLLQDRLIAHCPTWRVARKSDGGQSRRSSWLWLCSALSIQVASQLPVSQVKIQLFWLIRFVCYNHVQPNSDVRRDLNVAIPLAR